MTFVPALVATDLDGTLLCPDRTVSPVTLAALDRCREAGIPVVPATARQLQVEGSANPEGIAYQCGFTDWAVCSNGAIVVHLGTGEVVLERTLRPDVQREVCARLRAVAAGVEFFAVSDQGRTKRSTPGYPVLATRADHNLDPAVIETVSLADLSDRPVIKLIARHPVLTAAQLADEVGELPDVEVTSSGTPFLEISDAGVTKASGVAALAAILEIELRQVMAYGDNDNDAALLRAVGHGVAMPGGSPAAREAADEIASAGPEADGVARHLGEMLDRIDVSRR